MKIKTLKVGVLQTNCYIVSDGKSCIVIDPGDEADKIFNELDGLKVEKIILTHLHFDHILAVKELKVKLNNLSSSSTPTQCRDKSGIHSNKNNIGIYCHKTDIGVLGDNILQESDISGFLKENDKVTLNTKYLILNTISTPGHTPGSICLYFPKQNVLFSGDTIFKDAIGATHFKGGNLADLKNSILKKILTLPGETRVYPGHGEAFMLGDEKEALKKLIRN